MQKFAVHPYDNGLYEARERAANSIDGYENAAFIRLKNVSLSYTLPDTWKQKLHLQNMRLYMQAQNLWTITSYNGVDPETKSVSSLPPLRVITAGGN